MLIYRIHPVNNLAIIARFWCTICLLFVAAGLLAQAPLVQGFSPAKGPVGTVVTISGSNFSSVPAQNTVYFGGVKATVTGASSSTLTVVVPPKATYQPITITVNGLTGFSNNAFAVTYGSHGMDNFTLTSFAPYTNLSPSPAMQPVGIAFTDFDGDGNLDMASASKTGGFVAVFKNSSTVGNIAFAPTTQPNFNPGSSQDLLVADMDGDGKKDILIANGENNNVVILRNTSSGGTISFATAAYVAAGMFCKNIAVGDLNGDGKLDIAATTSDLALRNTVKIFSNNSTLGNISFASGGSFVCGNILQDLLIQDVDGNGLADLAVVSGDFPNNTLQLLRNTTTGATISFAAVQSFILNGAIGNNYEEKLAMGDLDEDGKADFAVTNVQNSSISILRNTSTPGSISLAPRTDIATVGNPYDIAMADISGDGKPDLGTIGYNSDICQLFLNKSTIGNMVFGSGVDFTTSSLLYNQSLAFGDLDGDGKADMGMPNLYNNIFFFFRNNIATPTLASFSPSSGSSSTTITIRGTGLSTTSGVSFGGVAASSFTVLSDTVVTAIPGPGTSGLVTITTASGSTASLPGFVFTGPAINSFTPTSAGARATVTIKGINLSSVTQVSFGNVPALSFAIQSDTLITAVVGPGASGNVTVSNGTASSFKAGFSFVAYPYITSFTPDSAGISTVVTIKGKYFTGSSAVRFGGANASSYTIVSDSVIRATVASGSSGTVSITNALGTGSLADFTFLPTPTITALSSYTAAIGTSITITGTNFSTIAANNRVSFGGALATVTAATATSLTVTVPNGARYAPVAVTVNGLTAFSTLPFNPLAASVGPITGKSFVNKTNATTNGSASITQLHDLDGDGLPEAICQNGSLQILLNTSSPGNPSFGTPLTIPLNGSNHTQVAIGDFDGDGKADIAVGGTNSGASGLWMLKNNSQPGNLSFSNSFTFVGAFLTNGGVGDFDKDGRLDVVFNSTNGSYIFINTSSDDVIGFNTALYIGITGGSTDYNLNVADFDGDGKQDFCTSNASGGKVWVMRNTSTGPGNIGFSASSQSALPFISAKYTAVGDINGDNKPDIVLLYDNTQFSVFNNQSSTGFVFFASRNDFSNNTQSIGLGLEDLNGDGKPDITLLDAFSNSVSVFRNTSNVSTVSFAARVQNWHEYNMLSITHGDVDGDGKTDIVVTDRLISVLRNVVRNPIIYSLSPVGGPAGTPVTIKGMSFTGTTAVQFSGVSVSSFTIVSDSVITAVPVGSPVGDLTITNAAGTGTLSNQYPAPVIEQVSPAAGLVGSLVNIKGRHFDAAPAGNTVFFGAVSAQVTAASDTLLVVRVPLAASYAPITVTANKRSAISQKFFNPQFSQGDTVLNNRSFEAKRDFAINNQLSTLPGNFTLHDLNKDGKPDVGVSGENNPTLLTNNSDSARILMAPQTIAGPLQYPLTAGDVDGDGRPDWVRGSGSNGISYTTVYRNRSNGPIQFDRPINSGTNYTISAGTLGYFFSTPALADLNGDGRPEIIGGSNNPGSPFRGEVLVMENQSIDNLVIQIPQPLFSTGTSAGIMRTADMDGDGKTDVLSLCQESAFGFTALRNTSTPTTISLATYQLFGVPGKTTDMALGDLDNDGKTDVAVVNNNGAYFSVFANNGSPGNISFASSVNIPTSAAPFGIAVGDVNGDGKPDVAITCTTDSTVHIYRNTGTPGNISFAPKLTYKTGSLPYRVGIVDIDKDGLPDLVVMNQGSNTVSVYRNRQGQPYTQELCNPIGGATLQTGISGSTYQWQLSTDSVNYVNISDGANYNGTNTANLQLINIPSAWYGYQYRCVVDGQPGLPTIIKFVNRWVGGGVSNDWHNPVNWSCGTVPDHFTDVLIGSGNVYLGNDASIRSLTLLSPATITIASGVTLTIVH